MATFIPERVGAAGARSIHIKRVLGRLDDGYVVRTPLRPAGWAPDFFIQHAGAGWLAIAVCDVPYAALAAGQLFDDGGRAAFDELLHHLAALPLPGRLVVMWACSAQEVRQLATRVEAQGGVHGGVKLLSKAEFLERGDALAPRLAVPVAQEVEHGLMGRYFSEAEIAAACTTRRLFVRDNSATLQRYFLDAQQEWAAKLDLAPPAEQGGIAKDFSVRLVNGVAGSGKTLIALSRAILLAELHPAQRVLVLIHNAPVVADLIAKQRRARGFLPANLEIVTFSAWVRRQWHKVYRQAPVMPDSARRVEEGIERYRAAWPVLRQPVRLLREELDFINESLITTEDQYCAASRAGRGFALRLAERKAVWRLFCAVTSAFQERGLTLWSALAADICLAEDLQGLERFHHVLMDEAQFCAPSWFQAVRLAMHPGSSLFLCADPNQGFMKSRLSWKSVGLDVAGRTRKLRKSYRTTRAILSAATQVLALHTQGDPEEYLVPDLGGMEPGRKPVLLYTDSPQDAVERLVNELGACVDGGGLSVSDLLVIYGGNVGKGLLYDRLCQRFGARTVWWFNKAEQRKSPPGGGVLRDYLRMANLESATGLEAGVVFLVGVEQLLSGRVPAGLGEEEAAAAREEQARKLYMAMTRAGARLVVLSCEPVPAEMGQLFEEGQPRLAG